MSIEATHVTLSALESHLWESANILRGPVDAADFKSYIFPLLLFKRISDVFDEEVAAALEESGGDQDYALFPENHHFQIRNFPEQTEEPLVGADGGMLITITNQVERLRVEKGVLFQAKRFPQDR